MSDGRGLYPKYSVQRADASVRHPDCEYFVLDVTHDPHAVPALMAYALSASEERPALAADLVDLANRHG